MLATADKKASSRWPRQLNERARRHRRAHHQPDRLVLEHSTSCPFSPATSSTSTASCSLHTRTHTDRTTCSNQKLNQPASQPAPLCCIPQFVLHWCDSKQSTPVVSGREDRPEIPSCCCACAWTGRGRGRGRGPGRELPSTVWSGPRTRSSSAWPATFSPHSSATTGLLRTQKRSPLHPSTS